MSRPGIRLRITTPGGAVLDVDSDALRTAATAKLGADDGDGWVNLWTTATDPWLLVAVKAVDLDDPEADQ